MLSAMLISIVLVIVGFNLCTIFNIEPSDFSIKNKWLTLAFFLLVIPYLISIGLLAKHRFFTPADIDGSGLTTGTSKAKILQARLQNTLEQFVLATIVYCGWFAFMPLSSIMTIPLASAAFFIGRLLFFMNYEKGAGSRAFGFALTFYPTVVMIISSLVYSIFI